MKTQIKLILFLVFTFLLDLSAQTRITFKADLQELIKNDIFSLNDSDKVVVRGNFNDWKGDDFQLNNFDDKHIHEASFNINKNIGDTLQYKFLIKKSNNRIYWEAKPNPENLDNGNRIFIIKDYNIILPLEKFSYDEFINYPVKFSKEKLREDFIQAREIIEKNHPALYDYTDKKILDSLFDNLINQIDSFMTFSDYYKLLSVVLERIGCGHTKLWIPYDFWFSSPKGLFPLRFLKSNNKYFVTGYYSEDSTIPIGSEILKINGREISKIFEELEAITSSDAFIKSFKTKSVEKNFPVKYALYYGFENSFNISYRLPGNKNAKNINLQPVNFEAVNKFPPRGNELSIKIMSEHNTAILTINTFIYYDQRDMFRNFIDSAFNEIKKEEINNLIIDLRGNDGGDPICAAYLLSYIEKEPVPYFTLPYGRYDYLAKPIEIAENNFKGNIYNLINSSCFSTTGHFCALLKYNKIGKFVGSETGSTFTCTGAAFYTDLKNTKLILGSARYRRYDAAVKNMDRTRGIIPDFSVEQSQEDIINNEDTVLKYTFNLIKQN